MAGGYSVTISAVDAATATLEGVNKRFEALNKRVAAAAAPFKRLGDQMNRFSEVTGIDKVATGFKNFGVAAGEAWRSVSRVVEPLAAITGAASIAGIVRLTQAWADFGTTLGNQAARAGVSADQLYNLQNAARLAGVDAGTLTASLTALNDNMRNGAIGAAPNFLNVLRAIGVDFRELQRMNPEQRVQAIADALGRVRSPTDRGVYTTALFGSEGITPFLRQGSAGIAQLEAQARRLAGVFTQEDVDRANAFRMAQVGLVESLTGLGNVVSATVAPGLTQLLGGMSDVVVQARKWVEANQEWISQKISDRVGEFVTWLKQVDWVAIGTWIHDIASRADSVAHALGGWQTVGEGLLLFFAGSWLAGMLLPFLTLGLAVGKLTWMIGTGLVGALRLAGVGAVALDAKIGALPAIAALLRLAPFLMAASLSGDTPGGGSGRRLTPEELAEGERRNQETNDRYGYNGNFFHDTWHWITGGTRQRPLPGGAMGNFENGAQPVGAFGQTGDMSLPRGIRNDNPLNLEYRGQVGTNGSDGRFGRYVDMQAGVAAGLRQLQLYQDRDHLMTVGAMIGRWAPSREVGNNTNSYVARVAAAVGVNPNAPIDLHNADTAARMIGAMARVENGRPIDPTQIRQGVDSVILPAASGAPATLSSSQAGQAGANGRVDMNVRIVGQPAVVSSRTSGDVNLNVATPGLLGSQ